MIFFGMIIAVLLSLAAVAKRQGWKDGKTDGWFVYVCTAVVVAVIGAMVSAILFSIVVRDDTRLTMYEEREAIYRARAEEVVEQIGEALLVVYPEYERELFAGMSPTNLDVYLVRYPELRAVEAVTEWTAQVRELLDKVYEQRSHAASTRQRLRFQSRNWAFTFPPFLPIPYDRLVAQEDAS